MTPEMMKNASNMIW